MEYDMWKEQRMIKCVEKDKTENNNHTNTFKNNQNQQQKPQQSLGIDRRFDHLRFVLCVFTININNIIVFEFKHEFAPSNMRLWL